MSNEEAFLLEHQVSAQLNEAVQQHTAQSNQIFTELQQRSSNWTMPPVPPQQQGNRSYFSNPYWARR